MKTRYSWCQSVLSACGCCYDRGSKALQLGRWPAADAADFCLTNQVKTISQMHFRRDGTEQVANGREKQKAADAE